ncbi:MAG: ORF6N domain-containing protein [Bacteroidales bacterium]|nr:ORF6N domain-containing protein [Bacteroidales bacterium]
MTEIIKIENIQNKIFTIRGVQVILDKDIAIFYEVKPIRLREQVKRNIARFPNDFMFQLTEPEVDFMVSQNAIPSRKQLGGFLPYVFTEQGVAAVSAVIKSKKAEEVSVSLMRAFVKMRKFITTNAGLFQRLDNIEQKQLGYKLKSDEKFEQIFKALEEKSIIPKQGVFYDGQIFDAYALIADIIRSAKNSIILIDNYIDDTVFKQLTKRKKNVKAIIYSKAADKIVKQDLKTHNAQYPKIELKKLTTSHDRFLIIDNKTVYHFGASLKDAGKKWFAFSKLDIDANDIISKL